MRGDVDGDGKITENDANQMSQHTTGGITLTGVDLWCADINGNGSVTNLDISMIRQYINGIATPLTKTPTFADYYNNWTYHKVDDLTGYWTAEIAINGLKTTSDAIVNIGNDEGIFYKSELSDGAIRFYATRPPIAEVPATITFKSGTGVITTSYESAKFHASTHSKDGADPITPTAIGAVGYDVAQTLTDDQKTQARGNIGAAPGGFGLGKENMVTIDDCNNAIFSGWYATDSQTINTPGGDGASGVLCVSRRYDHRIYQEFHGISGGQYSWGSASRITYGESSTDLQWGPWEWITAQMFPNVEYRTIERYDNKVIYKKLDTDGIIKWRLEGMTKWKPVAEYMGAGNVLQQDVTLYVSADGDDIAGDGSQDKPYRQIQTAINSLPKNLGDHAATINVLAGTYDGANISCFYGAGGSPSYGALQIIGHSRDDTLITGSLYFFNCNIRISVANVHVSNNSGNQYDADIEAYGFVQQLDVRTCIVDGTCGYGLYMGALNNHINGVICNNKNVAVITEWFCSYISMGGTGNTVGFQAGNDNSGKAALLIGNGSSLTASTLYQKVRGSIIFYGGAAV